MRYEIDAMTGRLHLDGTLNELRTLADALFMDHCDAAMRLYGSICHTLKGLSSFANHAEHETVAHIPAEYRQSVLARALDAGMIEREYRFYETVNVEPDCSACDDDCMIAGEWDYSDDATPVVNYYWLTGEPNPNDYATIVDADGTFRVGNGTLVSANDGDDRLYIWEFHAPAEADRYGHPMTARTTYLVSAEDGAAIVFTPR
jgi:hypothetical protein